MLFNIFKISLILSAISVAWTNVNIRITDDFSHALYVDSPFEPLGNKKYYFGKQKLTWLNAYIKCRSMGGFLASPHDRNQKEPLINYIIDMQYTDRQWWLSGANYHKNNEFMWYGSGLEFSPADMSSAAQLHNNLGGPNCVALSFPNPEEGELAALECDQPAEFICEAEEPRSVIVSSP